MEGKHKSREVETKYFDRIDLQGTIIEVGKHVNIVGGTKPGIYDVVDIQLFNKDILVWCKVDNRVIAFCDDEILGERWQKKRR